MVLLQFGKLNTLRRFSVNINFNTFNHWLWSECFIHDVNRLLHQFINDVDNCRFFNLLHNQMKNKYRNLWMSLQKTKTQMREMMKHDSTLNPNSNTFNPTLHVHNAWNLHNPHWFSIYMEVITMKTRVMNKTNNAEINHWKIKSLQHKRHL